MDRFLDLIEDVFPTLFRTFYFNRVNTKDIEGIRLYYSPIQSSIGAIVYGVLFILLIVVFSLNIDSLLSFLILLIGVVLLPILSVNHLARLLFKNPVLILDGNRLYYIFTDKWYDIMDYEFKDDESEESFYRSFYCMIDKEDRTFVFRLNNWHLHDEESFKLVLFNRRYLPIQ